MTTDTQLAPTDAEIEALGHRMCWRYTPAANQFRGSTHTFNRTTLLNFTRAALARWGAPTPVGVEPAKRQYYYKVDGCPAVDSESPGCICWHDEGAGPRATADPTLVSWRGADQVLAMGREPLTDEQIHAIYDKVARREPYAGAVTRRNIVRAIEAAHGIEGGQHGTE